MNYTKPTKASDVEREWHMVDVKDKVLGREATEIAQLLMGKRKPYFVRHLDVGDYVVVVNATAVKVTGDKEEKKIYTRYSGYPGGLKEETFRQLRDRSPEKIIRRAVSGMLPKNKLRKRMLSRLYVYEGSEHPHQDKVKVQSAKGETASQN